jgi:hypothetical protein
MDIKHDNERVMHSSRFKTTTENELHEKEPSRKETLHEIDDKDRKRIGKRKEQAGIGQFHCSFFGREKCLIILIIIGVLLS